MMEIRAAQATEQSEIETVVAAAFEEDPGGRRGLPRR
jgi:hypothetical protein